jgi:hypothetical protein
MVDGYYADVAPSGMTVTITTSAWGPLTGGQGGKDGVYVTVTSPDVYIFTTDTSAFQYSVYVDGSPTCSGSIINTIPDALTLTLQGGINPSGCNLPGGTTFSFTVPQSYFAYGPKAGTLVSLTAETDTDHFPKAALSYTTVLCTTCPSTSPSPSPPSPSPTTSPGYYDLGNGAPRTTPASLLATICALGVGLLVVHG